jgi:hypothetical protein
MARFPHCAQPAAVISLLVAPGGGSHRPRRSPMPDNPSGDDMATTSGLRSCPICAAPFARVRRQRYRSDVCRRTAWRRRHVPAHPSSSRSRRDGVGGTAPSTSAASAACATSASSGASTASGPVVGSASADSVRTAEPVAIPDLLTAAETPEERDVHRRLVLLRAAIHAIKGLSAVPVPRWVHLGRQPLWVARSTGVELGSPATLEGRR